MADSVHSQVPENVVDPEVSNGNNNNAQVAQVESNEAEPAQNSVSGSGEPLAPVIQSSVDTIAETNSQNPKPLEVTKSNEEGEIKIELSTNTAKEEKKEDLHKEPETTVNTKESQNEVKSEQSNTTPEPSGEWQQRETKLLKKIEELELVKSARSEDGLKLELKVRDEEIDLLKARVKNLETELQAALSKPSGKNQEMIEKIKQQHEELLSKARGMIFDKTKMVKNQELQIEALTTQVQSLKDINVITKDLLEIRNSEVKAMEERFQAMDARFKAEKERYALVLQRAQAGTAVNDDLRREYETQLAIFKELREKYEQRVQALVAENKRLKESTGGTSS